MRTGRWRARRSRGRSGALLALLGVTLILLGHAVSVAAAAAPSGGTVPGPLDPRRPGQPPLLGALLDWEQDSPAAYRDRLGLAPAVFGYTTRIPLDETDVANLARALEQARAEGARLLLTLLPEVPLEALDREALGEAVASLEDAGVSADDPVWLRPLPEMNAPWHPWGQQPTAFTQVFRELAGIVHETLPGTAVVWQPAYGAGYPFARGRGAAALDAGPVEDPALDTHADGRLTYRDDPYGPYWPGAGAVDWVGQPLYHWGDSYPFGRNELPEPGKLLRQLAGEYGYPDDTDVAEHAFYQRFAEDRDKPMVLETSALYAPSGRGVGERAVKRAWWQQLADPAVRRQYPRIGMVLYLEARRPEDETLGRVVDWRATRTPALAASFRRDLVEAARLVTGPTGPSTAGPEQRTGTDEVVGADGVTLTGGAAVLSSAAVGAAGVGLLVLASSRRRTDWAYDEQERRDLRIDLLRGLAICFVVVDHIDVPSLWQLLTQEAIGPVSGAELFVALSGVVLGVVYGPRVRDTTEWYDAATRMWRRSLTLWVTALVVVFLVYLVAVLPGIDATVLTTFTDAGTGSAGREAQGRVYELYAGFESLADYPVPGSTLRDILLLRMGPSQINIIGLYVVLLLLAPLMAWCLSRRLWAPLLAGSVGLYALNLVHPVRVLPSQFEDPFPLLSWQLLFVLGLVAGWHRRALLEAARRPLGRSVVVVLAVVAGALLLFSWSNPYLSNTYDLRLALLPSDTFQAVYDRWFARTDLGPGRVLATVCFLVTAYALLSRFWSPVDRALGWFLLPLGQATFYVFVVHVLFVVAVANVPALTENVWLGTLTHTVVLALLWLMVRTRFLFKVVPR